MKILDLMKRFFKKVEVKKVEQEKVIKNETEVLEKIIAAQSRQAVAVRKKVYKADRRREKQIRKRKAKEVLFRKHNRKTKCL